MIKALIFDFDGLILDTETPDVLAWQEIYSEHHADFPLSRWGQIIGGSGGSSFDAAAHLQELTGQSLDVSALRARQTQLSHALVYQQPVLPGVENYLSDARRMGLRLAVASSSPHEWVDSHLARLGLIRRFDRIVCAEDVLPGRTKPNPDLFLLALDQLSVQSREALVFEDSPNGVSAAHTAGIRVIAIPNPATSHLTFEGEDLHLTSFADLLLADLLARFEVQ